MYTTLIYCNYRPLFHDTYVLLIIITMPYTDNIEPKLYTKLELEGQATQAILSLDIITHLFENAGIIPLYLDILSDKFT